MAIEWIITTLLILVGGGLFLRKGMAFDQALRHTTQQEASAPVLKEITTRPPATQPDLFHRAIGHLWKGYQRALAGELILTFLQQHPTAPVAHFWIQQLMSIEPLIGREVISEELLERDFKPELAARCGPAG